MPHARNDRQQAAADAGNLLRPNPRNFLDRQQLLAKLRVFQLLRVGLLLLKARLLALLIDLAFLVLAPIAFALNIRLNTGRAVELAMPRPNHDALFGQLVDAPGCEPQQRRELCRLQIHQRSQKEGNDL